jgi:large subunit ribosomal protein L25
MTAVLRQFVPIVLHHPAQHAGVLQTVQTEAEVEALPANLPHQLDVDISGLLAVGDAIHFSDLTLPDNVILITNPEELIASLVPEAAEEAEEAAEEAEGEDVEGAEGEDADGESTDDDSESDDKE